MWFSKRIHPSSPLSQALTLQLLVGQQRLQVAVQRIPPLLHKLHAAAEIVQ